MVGYKKIALAATFSPRFLPLLAEARRIVQKLECGFSVIHVGPETPENREKFEAAFNDLAISPRPQILWSEGEPSDAIIQTVKAQKIDLLIAGALENETPGRHYLGNVARLLLRNAPCSLLLFTSPSLDPQPFRQIVAITDFSPLSEVALDQAYFMARQNAGEQIHLVRVFTIFAQVQAQHGEVVVDKESRRHLLEMEQGRIEEFAAKVGESPIPLNATCVEGTTGFATSDYVQGVNADLLVIPAQPPGAARILPDGMDWVFNVIPSNLFIVREPDTG
jgi:nucleotide-binding universal stress UspA family protein